MARIFLRDHLAQQRAMGMPVPNKEQLAAMEAEFTRDFEARLAGREAYREAQPSDLTFLGWGVWTSPIGPEPVKVFERDGTGRFWFEAPDGHLYGTLEGYDLEEDLPTLYMTGKLLLDPGRVQELVGPDARVAVILGDDGSPRFTRPPT